MAWRTRGVGVLGREGAVFESNVIDGDVLVVAQVFEGVEAVLEVLGDASQANCALIPVVAFKV